jgi:hypothetical protein
MRHPTTPPDACRPQASPPPAAAPRGAQNASHAPEAYAGAGDDLTAASPVRSDNGLPPARGRTA